MIKSKKALIFVNIYVILVIAAFIFFISFISKDALASLYIMILTFPWSYLEAIIWTFLNVTDSISEITKISTLIYYAFVNTFILYYLVSRTEKSYKKVIIEQPTDLLLKPVDKEALTTLQTGEEGRIIHSRYFKGIIFYKIELNDGRKGYVMGRNNLRVIINKNDTN